MKSLWGSLESIQSLRAVEAEWRHYSSDAFSALRAGMILQKAGRKAFSFPCQQRAGCWHQVVARAQGFVGKCKDDGEGCDDVLLTNDDVEVWELNVARLGRSIASALKCDPRDTRLDIDRTRQIASLGSAPLPILLSLPRDEDGFTDVVARLVARWPKGFVLLAPTVRFCNASSTELLGKVNAGFFPLEALVELLESGRFHAPKSGAELFAAHLPERQEAVVESESAQVWQLFRQLSAMGASLKAPPVLVFDEMVFKGRGKAETAKACNCAASLITRRVARIEAHFQMKIDRLRAFASDLEARQRTVKGDRRGRGRAGATWSESTHSDNDHADGASREEYRYEESDSDD